MKPLAGRLADAALRLSWAALPPDRQMRADWCVRDFLGCVIAGSARPELGVALLLARDGDVPVPGLDRRFDPESAAMVFATAGAMLQLHDLYPAGGYHPCLGVVSAAWAVWRGRGEPVALLMDAVVAGYEVANRLGDTLAGAQISNGFTPTATVGGIGAAVAAGRVLGLNADKMAAAISNAALCCPATPFQALSDHGNAVPLHGGLAARGGVQAALLAQAGWSAGEHALDGFGTYAGWLRAMGGDLDALAPEQWDGGSLDGVAWKLFPACGAAHMAIEAALQMPPIAPAFIEAVEIHLPAASMLLGARGPHGGELYDSVMSTRWSVCSALADQAYGPVTAMQFDHPNPARDALIARSHVVHDPALDTIATSTSRAATVVVRLVDGQVHKRVHVRDMTGDTHDTAHRGSMGSPDPVALGEKFRILTARHREAADALASELRA